MKIHDFAKKTRLKMWRLWAGDIRDRQRNDALETRAPTEHAVGLVQ